MQEVCYCGRRGDVEDREPVWRDGDSSALRCPECGHLDFLPNSTPTQAVTGRTRTQRPGPSPCSIHRSLRGEVGEKRRKALCQLPLLSKTPEG